MEVTYSSEGRTLKEAEQAAAKKVLEHLEHHESSSRLLTSAREITLAKMASVDPLSAEALLKLQENIGYFFHDIAYLKMALTHNSVDPAGAFQRFEFLGDAILRKIVLLHLIKSKSFDDHATLSTMTDHYIEATYQAAIAAKLNLSDYLIIASPISPAILSDALEALIAAIFIDFENYKHCKEPDELIIHWFFSAGKKFCPRVTPAATAAAGAGASVSSTVSAGPFTSADFPSLTAKPAPSTTATASKSTGTFKEALLKGCPAHTASKGVAPASYATNFPSLAEAYGKRGRVNA